MTCVYFCCPIHASHMVPKKPKGRINFGCPWNKQWSLKEFIQLRHQNIPPNKVLGEVKSPVHGGAEARAGWGRGSERVRAPQTWSLGNVT